MIIIEGPHPIIETTMYLPNPVQGDSIGVRGTVQLKRFMDGSTRTYVITRQGRRQFQMTFDVSREKSIEIEDFARIYAGEKLRLTDMAGVKWVGHFVSNPIELEGLGKRSNEPGLEKYRVQLIFEGKKL